MYKHLISTQRSQIFAYKQCGKSAEFIANAVGVHKSTIYRELARNTNKRGGYAHNAHEMAMERQERVKKMPLSRLKLNLNAYSTSGLINGLRKKSQEH